MSLLQDRVALITGSSRGIGAAIARRFAAAGARVALHGRDATALAQVHKAIVQAGGVAAPFLADLTHFAEIETLRGQVEETLGPVDVLVANAGGNPVPPGDIEQISEADWRASIDANLTTTFLTIKSILPGMKSRRRGNIITLSSAAARRAHAHSPAAYAAAKAAVQMLTQDLAAQVGAYAIRVNSIAPETILTERNLERIPAALQQTLAQEHPLKRLGTPEDVAEAALFLASEASAWITGVIVDVAGGAVMIR